MVNLLRWVGGLACLCLGLALIAAHSQQALPPIGPPIAIACAFNTSPPTVASGNAIWVQCDTNGKLITSGSAAVSGTTSNASSAVATSATNIPTVSYNYAFNGTTWDQVSSLSVGSKHAPTVAIVDASGNQITTFGGAASQNAIGNVGGLTKTVCVTPTVTNGTYAANVVVGGLLTFSNLFTSTGHGVIQTVAMNFTTAQTVGFKLYPFRGSPTNASTWTDHSAAAISGSTDIFLTDQPIQLANPDSGLSATMTNYGAIGLGQAYNPAGTSGFFVLVPTATTASLGGTASVVQVCVTVLQDS